MLSSSLKTNPVAKNNRTLYVEGINARVTEEDLRDHFSAYSELEFIKMVPQHACAFVTYTTQKGAEKAANQLSDNLQIKGILLKLSFGLLKTPPNEERQQSVAHNDLMIQLLDTDTDTASHLEDQQPPPLPHPFYASTDTAEGSTSATEMTLQAMQSTLMCRCRLLAQREQQDVWCVRLAEAEARMSSQLRKATTQTQLLKEAAEARAAAAVREVTEKSEELREELKYAAYTAVLRERAKLMREFLDGKSSSWDPQAEIDFYVAHIGDEADLV